MAWIQLKLNTDNKKAEKISDFLIELGAVSITYTDCYDTPIFEPMPGETRLWENTDITALFDADTELQLIIAALNNSELIQNNFIYKIEQVEDKDWQKEWMENYHPIKFGNRIWICPSWKPIPDPLAINIMLDPGLAFGTGTHPTTAMCLEWLDSIDLTNKDIIDFGCGSGILAITGLKLGAKKATGIDIDPQAILASTNNAEKNNVAKKLNLYLPENKPLELQADFVVANILAGPLKELYPTIKTLVKNNGYLALSGILSCQAQKVIDTYKESFEILEVKETQEWCIITMQKN